MRARIATIALMGSWCLTSFAAPPEVPADSLAAAKALQGALIHAIATAEKSVVAIARGRREHLADLDDPKFVPREYATGVVVGRRGLILTNYHVLGDTLVNSYVVWSQGKAYSNVRVKAADPWTDLAILEVDAKDMSPIEMSSSKDLKKGSIVVALGNPHAIARDGNVSATWGIVANLSRKVDGPLHGRAGPDTVVTKDRETRYHFGGLIQTDAKLVSGTSGGPLLNLDGKMIGLTTTIAALAGFERGSSYAIPVDEAFERVLEKLKRGEEIEQGFLGVKPANPKSSETGVVLSHVEMGTPAGIAGLREADEITSIDGHPIRNVDDLFFKVGSLPPDHVAQIRIRRGFGEETIPVRLTKKPGMASRPMIVTADSRHWRGLEVDYSTAFSHRRLLSLDPRGSVVVRQVEKDSPAWAAGLRPGILISQVNDMRVGRPEDFFRAVEGIEGGVRITTFGVDGNSLIIVE